MQSLGPVMDKGIVEKYSWGIYCTILRLYSFFSEGAIKNLSEDVPGSDLFFRKITLGIARKEHWTKTRPVRRPRLGGETARKVGRETLKSKAKVEFPRRVSRHGR